MSVHEPVFLQNFVAEVFRKLSKDENKENQDFSPRICAPKRDVLQELNNHVSFYTFYQKSIWGLTVGATHALIWGAQMIPIRPLLSNRRSILEKMIFFENI